MYYIVWQMEKGKRIHDMSLICYMKYHLYGPFNRMCCCFSSEDGVGSFKTLLTDSLQGKQALSLLRNTNYSWDPAYFRIPPLCTLRQEYHNKFKKKLLSISPFGGSSQHLAALWDHTLYHPWSRWKSHTIAVLCPLVCPGVINQPMKLWIANQRCDLNYIEFT